MSSKELVISQNRHETKVAILEDGQLVEVFFQRANEYSLAGSIHKGRVTRVLPGMQSAFVDLGLERDCFLYVSDFFEENADEIDRVGDDRRGGRDREGGREAGREGGRDREGGRGREDRDRGRGRDRNREDRSEREVAPAPIAVPVEIAAEAVPVVAAEAAQPVEGGVAADSGADAQNRGRGRRSRRRRRGGRGFPESKYAAGDEQSADEQAGDDVIGAEAEGDEGAEEAAPVIAAAAEEIAEPVAAAPVFEEVSILPGESLAKYRKAAAPRAEPVAAPKEEAVIAAPVAEELPAAAYEEAADDAAEEILERVDAVGYVEEPVAEAEPEPEPMTAEAELEAEADEPPTVTEAELEAIQAAAEAEISGETDDVPVADEDAVDAEASVDDEAEGGAETEEGSALDLTSEEVSGEEAAAEGGDENPAEGQSATVRAQGGRAPHRISRRMRRRGRGGRPQEGQAEGETPAVVEGTEPRIEAVPVVMEARAAAPERSERGERRDRGDRDRGERGDRERSERPERERPPLPSIADLLKEGQEIIVQIAKEPLGQKGARITSHIALPGRYVVYMPTVEHLGVSRKISTDEERQRLKRILQKHREGIAGGYIMRTAGEGRSEEDIAADMQYLASLWLDIKQKAEKRRAPMLLHHDVEVVQRLIRDQLTDGFKAIWVDNEDLYEQVLHSVERVAPAMLSRVKMYTRPEPVFDAFGITQELEKALRPKVWLKSGGYIVINQTEALVAIDVNTGKYVGKSNRLEDTIVKTNLEAVKEIVRQMRLRDLGGIIVVDFIDMDERKNRQKVMQALEEVMRADKAPYKILQFNDFGLVAITRKRVKQSLERALCSPCPHCEGAGYVKSVQTVVSEILAQAQKYAKVVDTKDVVLRVNPEIAKVMKSVDNQYLEELEEVLGRPVLVNSDPLLHQEKFDLA